MISLAVLVRVRVGLQSTPSNVALMSITYLLAALPFFAGGAVVSHCDRPAERQCQSRLRAPICSARPPACLLLMPALNRLGAPGAIVAAGVIGGGGGGALRVARRAAAAWWRSSVSSPSRSSGSPASPLGPFTVSITKGHEHHAVLFSKWNSFSRIGVYDQPYGAWSLSERYTGPLPDTHLMDIDSAAGTQILRFRRRPPRGGVPAVRADRASATGLLRRARRHAVVADATRW